MNTVRKIDSFGEPFEFDLDGKSKKLKSGCGVLATVFMGLIVSVYAYLRFDVFINRTSMDILQTVEMQYLDDSFEFTTKNGFGIAAMFTAYDNEEEPILTPEYGELTFEYTSWGQEEDGTFYERFENLATHYCTEEELGLLGSEAD